MNVMTEEATQHDVRRKAALMAANNGRSAHMFCIERGCCTIQVHDSIWCRKHRDHFAKQFKKEGKA